MLNNISCCAWRDIFFIVNHSAPGRLQNAMRSDMFSPIILQRSGNIREINLTDPGIRSDKYFTSEREILFKRGLSYKNWCLL